MLLIFLRYFKIVRRVFFFLLLMGLRIDYLYLRELSPEDMKLRAARTRHEVLH